jgi:hypothetical protein
MSDGAPLPLRGDGFYEHTRFTMRLFTIQYIAHLGCKIIEAKRLSD